ncbi:MAG: hypothetical protein ACK504_06350 [Bacteroidota bacterium]
MATKFNLNRKPLNEEEINSRKDFDELLKKFKQQSIEKARNDSGFLKNKKVTYSTIIAGMTVLCTVTYFSVFKNQPSKNSSKDKINVSQKNKINNQSVDLKKAFIAPPISKLTIPYQKFKIKNEKGATLKTQSNSKIIIPKNSFVNKKGEEIIGDVEIQFREFHHQADIIASGIPMKYDSAGIHTHLESAGMIDIKGFQNNEPIFIHPKKEIIIELQSSQTADKFNMYALDTIKKNWTYLHRDNSLKNLKKKNELRSSDENELNLINEKTETIQKQIDAIPPKIEQEKISYSKKINQLPKVTEPIKPSKVVEGRPQFQLDVSAKEFPELATFKNMVFEVGSENKNYNPKLADITWGSAEISEGTQKGKNYLLTLKLRERVEKLIVYPALSGKDYEEAIKQYDAKFTEYKSVLAKRLTDEKKLKEEFEKKQAEYIAEQKRLTDNLIKEQIKIKQEREVQLQEQFNTIGNQQRVTRIFQVSNFGIYNSDCPNSMPQGETIRPTYLVNETQPLINLTGIYLVCTDKNLVYYLNPAEPLRCNPNEKYSLCIIANGKTFVCNTENFMKHKASKNNKFNLTEISASIDNIVDFKKALGV